MKILFTAFAATTIGAGSSFAGGIERTPQSLAPLFEKGNYAEFGFGVIDPTVRGHDLSGTRTGDAAQGFGLFNLSYKHQFTDALSGAFIIEQPFGADILYPTDTVNASGIAGTRVRVDSTTYTALLRYKFDNQFSVHGGVRASRANGQITLAGASYGPPLHGYNLDLAGTWGTGWVAGVAYEVPEIAARVSLTYNSAVSHDFNMTETGDIVSMLSGGASNVHTGKYEVKTPRSWVLEGQTGIAEDTLLFGSVRWVNWTEFKLENTVFPFGPIPGFSPVPLIDVEDTTTYSLGVGHQFNDSWAGLVSFSYEPSKSGGVSPLGPVNGHKTVNLAAIYTVEQFKIGTGISYSKLGETDLEIGQPGGSKTVVAKTDKSDAWGVGMKVGYSF